MKWLRFLFIAVSVAGALGATAGIVQANPLPGLTGCSSPGCAKVFGHDGKHGYSQHNTLAGAIFGSHGWYPGANLRLPAKQKLPVFQAAPWYMYWPYDGYFLTPAPITGAFYGPPVQGNFPVNPYFPPPPGTTGTPQQPVPPGYPLPPPMPLPPP